MKGIQIIDVDHYRFSYEHVELVEPGSLYLSCRFSEAYKTIIVFGVLGAWCSKHVLYS